MAETHAALIQKLERVAATLRHKAMYAEWSEMQQTWADYEGVVRDAILALHAAGDRETCEWREDEDGNWYTTCGEIFVLNNGTPADNSMKFCAYCGGVLVEVRYVEPPDEDEAAPPVPEQE